MSAPNISLLNATYSAVSGVTLPKSGGGTATFPWVEGSDTVTQNGTVDVTSLAELVVNVSGGGASNIAMGTFTTGETRASTGTFSINYTGSGYPIALIVVVNGGMYNNTSTGDTTWYNSKTTYDAGLFCMVKANTTVAPSYSNGTDDIATKIVVYKGSSSSATTYSVTQNTSTAGYMNSISSAGNGANCVKFKGNGTTVSYYIGNKASNRIGLAPSTEFQYIAIYSS